MAKLFNQTRGTTLATEVEVAQSFLERTVGLMGRARLADAATLWIHGSRLIPCNSIHTGFMRFSLDAVFVDRSLKVVAIYRGMKPWRMTRPVRGAWSVFEFAAGGFGAAQVEVGDVLNVGD